MTMHELVTQVAEQNCKVRPYRLGNESTEEYRKILAENAPLGPFIVDMAPPLDAFSEFVCTLTKAWLTNLQRCDVEWSYRTGLWDDAWNGFFYDRALTVSLCLAFDYRLMSIDIFSHDLRFFHGVRAYQSGRYLFLKKGETEEAGAGNSISLPIDALSVTTDNPDLAEISAMFGSKLIIDLRKWIGTQAEPAIPPKITTRFVPHEFDVFLSHSTKDMAAARELALALSVGGKRVFFSAETLPAMGSADYMKAIDEALEGSTHFVLFGTKRDHIMSSWVEAEWRLFINEKRSGRKAGNFLSVVSGTLSSADLPLSLRYYEVIPTEGDYIQRILAYII